MRILLVDDEPFFLEELKLKLKHFSAELGASFDVIAECYSGQEALAQMNRSLPEVVFTDIRMASLNGIELAKSIHQRWPQLPVVIISGYPSFEYALEAMRANVTDYLLKPLDSAALKIVLHKLLSYVESASYSRSKELLRACLSPIKQQEVMEQNNLDIFPYSVYRVVFIQGVDALYDVPLLMPQDDTDYGHFRTQLAQYLHDNEESWLFPSDDGRSILLIMGIYQDGMSKLHRILPFTQLHFSRNGISPSLSISEPLHKLSDLSSLLQKLHNALYERLIIGIPQLIYLTEQPAPQPVALHFSKLDEQRFLHLLSKNDQKGLKEQFIQCFAIWQKNNCPSMTLEMNMKRIAQLLDQHYRLLHAVQSKTLETRIEEIVYTAHSFAELEEAFWSMLANAYQFKDIWGNHGDEAKLFAQIETYISANIGQPLSLQVLTKQFHISSTFVCNLFREKSGKSFVEYITFLRMQKSQEFIRIYPNMRNKEIAEIVGYYDQNYFSRVFKTVVGISPTEYRASLGKS